MKGEFCTLSQSILCFSTKTANKGVKYGGGFVIRTPVHDEQDRDQVVVSRESPSNHDLAKMSNLMNDSASRKHFYQRSKAKDNMNPISRILSFQVYWKTWIFNVICTGTQEEYCK